MGKKSRTPLLAAVAMSAVLFSVGAVRSAQCTDKISAACLERFGAGAEKIEPRCRQEFDRYLECLDGRIRDDGAIKPPSGGAAWETAAQAAYEAARRRGDRKSMELVAKRFRGSFWGELAAEDLAKPRGPDESPAAAAPRRSAPEKRRPETPAPDRVENPAAPPVESAAPVTSAPDQAPRDVAPKSERRVSECAKIWREASRKDTCEAYDAYLAQCPSSPSSASARLIQSQRDCEDDALRRRRERWPERGEGGGGDGDGGGGGPGGSV